MDMNQHLKVGHRDSISSTNSLDVPPIPPSRTPKRVSFSDNSTPTPLPTNNDETHSNIEFNPMNHFLQKAASYLEQLHDENRLGPSKIIDEEQKDSSKVIATIEPIVIENPPRGIDRVDESSTPPTIPVTMENSPASSVFELRRSSLPNFNENSTQIQAEREDENQIVSYLDRYHLDMDHNYSYMELEVRREKIRWLLISECSLLLGDGKHTREGFRKLFLDEEFQQKLFHLFDIDGQGFLVQDRWIEHLKGRLTEDRQKDFAEQLESVAYVICGESKITFNNFEEIWEARGIIDKFYRLIDVDGTNLVSTNQVMEFISKITNLRPRNGFDKKSLEQLESLFRRTVGNEKEISRAEFKKIVTSKNPFFTDRVFQIFDKDSSGSISLQEFIDAIHQFSGQSADDKIRFLFKVYDIDGDGLIQHKELHDVIRACMEENGMRFSEDQIEDLTTAMFEDADPYNRGTITYEALKNQLHKHGGLLENLSITIDRWLVPIQEKPKPKANKRCVSIPHQFTGAYVRNNQVFVSYLFVYIAINVGLFVSRAIQYRNSNFYTILARACGQCLNFNCAWVLVLMLRHSLTYLRSRGFSSYLPLDNHIYLHKLTGMVISGLSVIHTVMHLINFSTVVVNHPRLNGCDYSLAEWLFTSRPGLFGLIKGWANPTGCALIVILMIMFVCSQPFVRRKGSFEVFYWTHLLYVPFWILTIFHGPNFWKWFILPGLVYAVERILRFVWMKSEHGKTYISSGLLLPSKVVHLVIKRPYNFNFRPGDYIFVNIPSIANYEWHPFTISSAPEQEDYMWLHIRGVGEWTNRLSDYFEKEQEKLHNGEINPHIPQNTTDPASNGDTNGKSSTTPQTDFLAKMYQNGSEPRRPPRQNQGMSKLAIENNNTKADDSGNKTIKNIKETLQRTFSKKETSTSKDSGISNDGFVSDEGNMEPMPLPRRKVTPDKRLQKLINKVPLEKSLSMPDMEGKFKKRERIRALREYTRSESEKSFDQAKIRRARLQTLGLAYLSPQNKSLAQSFRYMRHKPTIIAFKTPSLENCEPRPSSNSMIVSPGMYSQREAEEGQIVKRSSSPSSSNSPPTNTQGVNYPVGKPLEIYIDGPYGAPSSHIFGAQHAVLIATGIGVTPFASILQSIMHRYWKARHSCPRCEYEWASDIPRTVMNLRKVDFFWINRDQRSFEWFVNLLSQLEIEQAELGGAMERFLDMHMYITSALQKTDMKAVGLQLALDLLHEKGKRDLITGLKTRTNAGRPNWDKVFKQLQDQKKGKVTVFYCGPAQLAKTLRYKCDQYEFAFRKECF
ncbi:NADPH oxidase 5 isoform X2 [Episyrphus balteatus]|uniref:NADPH oxidase 5 isoform X2 n=1 Tax=Episyrphus balteatus TaxID=286459 RepID=UPI0024858E02|nr:NADPH oxidase 5 isoform X2 [Episyrphus balteatus]